MLGDSMRRRRGPDVRVPKTGGLDWPRWILGGMGAVVGSFAVGYAVAVLLLFPAPADAGEGVVVPELTGEQLPDAERRLSAQGLVVAEVMELPNSGAATGVVLAQTPLPGQLLQPGGGVRLAISSGAPRGVVPALAPLLNPKMSA